MEGDREIKREVNLDSEFSRKRILFEQDRFG